MSFEFLKMISRHRDNDHQDVILATNRDPETHNGKVIQTATHLTWILAEYLAETIAWLMRSILDHASKILFDNDTQPLLTPSFWILPLYRELLNSARRI